MNSADIEIEHVRTYLTEIYGEHLLFMDGYDDCILGVCNRFGQEPIVAYDYKKIIEKLIKDDEMSLDQAREFFEFNQLGAWVGEHTPCFVDSSCIF